MTPHDLRRRIAVTCEDLDHAARRRTSTDPSIGYGLFELRFALGPTARRITYRFTKDGRIILLTTFRKQRQNERHEIARARQVTDECARRYP